MKIESVSAEDAAKWFVVGFTKCWSWYELVSALGLSIQSREDAEALHAAMPFMPPQWHHYEAGRRQRPIRAVVAACAPRLHAYLDMHHGKPEKLLAAIPGILKLDIAGRRMAATSEADKKEQRKAIESLKRVEAANKAARRQQLSTQRGAWNVCKG